VGFFLEWEWGMGIGTGMGMGIGGDITISAVFHSIPDASGPG